MDFINRPSGGGKSRTKLWSIAFGAWSVVTAIPEVAAHVPQQVVVSIGGVLASLAGIALRDSIK